jgi:hypothetical protein
MKIFKSATVQFANDENWRLLSSPATTNEEPCNEDLDSSGTLFSDVSIAQPFDEGMESLTSLFSGVPIEQPFDEGMELLSPLFLEINLQYGGNWQLLSLPASQNEEPRDEDLDPSGKLFSGVPIEQPFDEGMESLTSLFPGMNLQLDENRGMTALSPPPKRRTGPPDEDRTTLDEPSLARVDTGLLTELHQKEARPLQIRRVIEVVSPRFIETVGRNLRVPILSVELDATTSVHHPPSMEIRLMSDIDRPCNIWLQGPGKNNMYSEDPVVIHGRYLDIVSDDNGSWLLRFVFFAHPLRITNEGRYRISYTVRDSEGHALRTLPLKGKCFVTQWCPEFSKSQPSYAHQNYS